MIKSFVCKETEKLFNREVPRKWSTGVRKAAARKLRVIHASTNLEDLRTPPGNHLEKLTKDRKGQHSIKINDQWRICFNWRSGNAYNVEITDYH